MLGRLLRWLGRSPPPALADLPWDLSPPDRCIIGGTAPFTMTSTARLAALITAVRHIVRAGIPGAVVECGVWRGGSMMAAALALLEEGEEDRDLFLYDTFAGMPPPTAEDVRHDGVPAAHELEAALPGKGAWAHSPLQEVRANLATTGYPPDRIHYVAGKVEDTLPAGAPERIALLRLDTDWYASTRHELEHLYPRLSPGGILIVDDYGYWRGARQAVDEYFERLGETPFLHRIDETGRLAVKR